MTITGTTGSLGTSDEDPELAGDVASFHDDLMSLRAAAGAPSYARLARRIGQPRSTVYDAFTRPSLPALDLLTALVAALDGDPGGWRDRWTELRTRVDSILPSEAQDPGARTSSDGAGRRIRPLRPAGPAGRRWWLVTAGAVVVAAAGAAVLTTVLASGGDGGCTTYRTYRVSDAGDLITASSEQVAPTSVGDVLLVSDVHDHTFESRYPAIDASTGKQGYVDESKIDYLGNDVCV